MTADLVPLQVGDVQVNTYTSGNQTGPSIASNGSGRFVVVWESEVYLGSYNYERTIRARRFDSNGGSIGSEFVVDQGPHVDYGNFQGVFRPDVAMDPAGGFVVVWEANGATTDGSYHGIRASRFDSGGNRIGSEFQINTYTTGAQRAPRVATTSAGSFVVVWASYNSPLSGANYVVVGRRFDSSGNGQDSDFQISTGTLGYYRWYLFSTDVAVHDDGRFVVVWRSEANTGTDTDGRSVQRRLFASDGSPLENDFQVNTHTTGHQSYPSITGSNDGFIVTWLDSDQGAILVQRSTWEGIPSAREFQANSVGTPSYRAALDVDPSRRFVVAWSSNGSVGDDTDSLSVQGQRFRYLFLDGFESGSICAWSSAVPAQLEVCDSVDNDCNGLVDDIPGSPTWYEDFDGDGFGNPDVPLVSCSQPAEYVGSAGDCYDGNASAHPIQTLFFTTDRGDGSYDYDCNLIEEMQNTEIRQCGSLSCGGERDGTGSGWAAIVPGCENRTTSSAVVCALARQKCA